VNRGFLKSHSWENFSLCGTLRSISRFYVKLFQTQW